MSRSLRILYPNAHYHVMNRGLGRQKIFHDVKDYEFFLDLLEKSHHRYKAEILAYCLMSNHYHICINTPLGNLNAIMRYINSLYAKKCNKNKMTDGPIFRGRYKAILIDTDDYLIQVNRYIHLNPVSAKIVLNPENYQWSSYSYYVGNKNKPDWLFCDKVLDFFGNTAQIEKFRHFTTSNINQKIVEFYDGSGKIPAYDIIPVLGSENFMRDIKENHLNVALDYNIPPQQSRLIKYFLPSVEEIIEAVARYYQVEISSIKKPIVKRSENKPRKIAFYLACDDSGKTHKEIAESFEGLSPSSFSKAYFRIKNEIIKNELILKEIESIRASVANTQIHSQNPQNIILPDARI